MAHQLDGCLEVQVKCIHIEAVVNHQLGAVHGAELASSVQCRLSQAVQSCHIGPSFDQNLCAPDGNFV